MSLIKGTPLERLLLWANRLVTPLVRRGLPLGSQKTPMVLLTVRGRKSGQLRTVPVSLLPNTVGWTLISVYGVSDWSRNLEAAGSAMVTMRGTATNVTAERLSPHEAAPILRDALAEAPKFVRKVTSRYYRATPESTVQEWELEALEHPVFQLTPVRGRQTTPGRESD